MGFLTSLLALIAAVAVALPVRIYQLTRLVDYSTGFYQSDSMTNYAFIFVILLLCAVAAAPILLGRFKADDFLIKQRYRVIGAFQTFLGFSVVYEAGVTIGNFIVGKNVSPFDTVIDLFGLAVGFILLIIGFNLMMGNLRTQPMSSVSLIPVLYYAVKMIRTFMQLRIVAAVSQNVLTVLFSVSMVLFMFSYARVLSDIHPQKGIQGCLIYGFLASTISLVSVVPRLYVFWFAGQQATEAVAFPEISEIAASLFVTVFTVNLMVRNIRKPEKRQPQIQLP